MKRMFRYSAMKSTANFIPEYSTLKPDTNSDSPSAKSKGVRLVSASITVNQIKVMGLANCPLNVSEGLAQKALRSSVLLIIAKKIRVRIIGIS